MPYKSTYANKSTYVKTKENQTKKSNKYNNYKHLSIGVNSSGSLKVAAKVQIGNSSNKPINAKKIYFGNAQNSPVMIACFSNCTCNSVCDCDQVSVCTCDSYCNCNTVQYCSCDQVWYCSCDNNCGDCSCDDDNPGCGGDCGGNCDSSTCCQGG